jgi:cell division protein FtsW (lipid II flippase)
MAANLDRRVQRLLYGRQFRWTEMWLLVIPALFVLIGLLDLLIAFNPSVAQADLANRSLPPIALFTPAIGFIVALAGTHILLNIVAPDADQVLLPLAGMLASIGVIEAIRYGSDPTVDNPALGSKQLLWVIAGLALCVATVRVTRDLSWLRNFKYTWAVAGIALVGVTVVAGLHNFSTSNPGRDVLNVPILGVTFQPSELLKICLVIFFAGYLSENREMLAAGGYRIGPFPGFAGGKPTPALVGIIGAAAALAFATFAAVAFNSYGVHRSSLGLMHGETLALGWLAAVAAGVITLIIGFRNGLTIPPVKHLGPLVVMLGIALVLFIGVRELGLAMLVFGLVLAMLYLASDRFGYVIGSLIVFAVGAFVAYHVVSYARVRVDIVGNAFSDPHGAGYQIVQGLITFAHGAVFGDGLGLGHPAIVPASNTDFIAATFGEEFGFAGLLALIGLFMLLVYRGMHIATRARDTFSQLLAAGLSCVFALQTLVILAGNLKIMPLTGVPLPFVAYGGSSVIANFIIIGLLLRVSQTRT